MIFVNMKEVIDAVIELNSLKQKFDQNESLDIDELEKLFLFFQVENCESMLSDPRFEYAYFRQLYNTYGQDLEFKSTFYKRNPGKRLNEIVDYKKLRELNSNEYNYEIAVKIKDCLIQNQYYIPIDCVEVAKNQEHLKEVAKKWASVCLNEKHSDEELKIIAKETRDTLKKKNIESYLEDRLNTIETSDVFKGLLKTYSVFHEVKKILRSIEKKVEPKSFLVNGIKIEITFYSLVHIYNRHFAEILSSSNFVETKSFHDSKIDPSRINFFIEKLFNLINNCDFTKKVSFKKGESLLICYRKINYALFFNYDKYDKTKMVLETFFVIEPDNTNAQTLIDRIESSTRIKLDEELSVYIENSN